MASVYLIHFDKPIGNPDKARGQAQHYIGFAKNLKRRIAEHQSGNGSRILQVVNEQGIGWRVARTWSHGSRGLERRLKNYHKARQLCPICRAEKRNHETPC